MTCVELARTEEWSVPAYLTRAASEGRSAVYLSTGVHGDEAGSAWGVLAWAKANARRLREEAFVICPCLNPVGLALNTRADHRGLDINRRFHLVDDPLIGAWQRWVRGFTLHLGLCLHEDYDAPGCYVYELSGARDGPLSASALRRAGEVILPDPRAEIEGSPARGGIIQRREVPQHIEGPEAIVLYEMGCPVTLTFETPSEFGLDIRVRAQQTFIEAAIEHLSPHRA